MFSKSVRSASNRNVGVESAVTLSWLLLPVSDSADKSRPEGVGAGKVSI